MKYEYLLLNALILAGPILFSFDRKVNYVSKWPHAIGASIIVLVPFIVWDVLVTGRHWWFNEKFTSEIALLGLPLGEWLFFITVPFACLFIWEIIVTSRSRQLLTIQKFIPFIAGVAFLTGVWFFFRGLEYTGLVGIAIGLIILLDLIFSTGIVLQKQSYLFLLIVTMLVLIFNGYLTARPVVLYDEQYQLGFRIVTIPLEDFFYGYSLLLLNVIVYEKILRRGYAY
jgi:lycopene cyclase domain-containing protein